MITSSILVIGYRLMEMTSVRVITVMNYSEENF